MTIRLSFRSFLLIALVIAGAKLSAQSTDKQITGIPYQLSIYNDPVSCVIKENSVEITAKGKTNLFNNPNGQSNVDNAPMLLFEPKGDFKLTAKVTGELKAVYDVAALVVYNHRDMWAKLCYENAVSNKPTIVSVVTRILSDDCNSFTVGKYAYLSIVKKDTQYSFFYSKNGKDWEMIRHFSLDIKKGVKVGFASHGSRGTGFTAKFSEIQFEEMAMNDMRNPNR